MAIEVPTSPLAGIRRLSEEIRLCDRRRKELVIERRELIDANSLAAEFEPGEKDGDRTIDRSTGQLPAIGVRPCTEDDYDLDFADNDSNGNA